MKVGDRVIVIDTGPLWDGQMGVIDSYDNGQSYYVLLDGQDDVKWFRTDELKLADDPLAMEMREKKLEQKRRLDHAMKYL